MFSNFTKEDWAVFGLFGAIILFIIVLYIIDCSRGFSKELKLINIEIGRTTGREQRHWKKKKKRLFLSLIPFVKYK